ncbi:hypothetical protein EB155_01605 [archaeon]|nr:hypothetical protein [archaeon]NDB78535.1 hypothetical protein [archaeon]NDF28170.1 hypothetical protein [archaeon]
MYMTQMDYKLKRLIYDYEDQPIKIKSLIDREESLKFEKYRIKLKKDRVIKIPYWVGKILKKMNYVEYISEDSSEPGELKRIVQRERMESSLTKLERFYYRIILNEMKNLSEEKNTESIFALESIKKNFEELFEIRTKKILSMVRTSNPPRKNDLLLDEKIFFDGLNYLYNNGLDNVEKIKYIPDLIEVEALKNLEKLPLKSIYDNKTDSYMLERGNLKEGEKKKISLDLAEVLEEAMFVNIISKSFLSKGQINDIIDHEIKYENELARIDDLFYYFLKKEISLLNQKENTTSLRLSMAYQGNIHLIYRSRIRKILKEIAKPYNIEMKDITKYEKKLMNEMKGIYISWYQKVGDMNLDTDINDNSTFSENNNKGWDIMGEDELSLFDDSELLEG